MPYNPAKKKTLLIPSGPAHDPDRKHLFIIINDVCKNGLHLLISISTIKKDMHYDPTCTIQGGGVEHKFIKDDSFVAYDKADTHSSLHIRKMVDGWLYKPHEDVSDGLFDRICAGILASDEIKIRITRYYEAI